MLFPDHRLIRFATATDSEKEAEDSLVPFLWMKSQLELF